MGHHKEGEDRRSTWTGGVERERSVGKTTKRMSENTEGRWGNHQVSINKEKKTETTTDTNNRRWERWESGGKDKCWRRPPTRRQK